MTLDLLEAFTKDLASRKGSSDPPPASSLKRPAAARSAAVRVTPEEEQLLKRAYTVAITACGRVGQWQMAVELMSKMLAQGKLAGGKKSRPMAVWHSVSTTWDIMASDATAVWVAGQAWSRTWCRTARPSGPAPRPSAGGRHSGSSTAWSRTRSHRRSS